MRVNQVFLAAGQQAHFHRGPWMSKKREQTKRMRECTAQNTHKQPRKGWHLIRAPSTAKALYSPQLVSPSHTHPKPGRGKPSLRVCFKEARMVVFFFRADMTFSSLTPNCVLLYEKKKNPGFKSYQQVFYTKQYIISLRKCVCTLKEAS